MRDDIRMWRTNTNLRQAAATGQCNLWQAQGITDILHERREQLSNNIRDLFEQVHNDSPEQGNPTLDELLPNIRVVPVPIVPLINHVTETYRCSEMTARNTIDAIPTEVNGTTQRTFITINNVLHMALVKHVETRQASQISNKRKSEDPDNIDRNMRAAQR